MSHLAPPTVASTRRRRVRQTGASALLAMGLVVTVFSAPSLAEDAAGQGAAAGPSLSIAQCRDRATDQKPVADGCGDYKEQLLREAAQRQQADQRQAEVQAAAEREAEAQRKAEAEEQARRDAEAKAAAEAEQDDPIVDLPVPDLPTVTLPTIVPPSDDPSDDPTDDPTDVPTVVVPTDDPSDDPSDDPTDGPTGPTLPTSTGQPTSPGGGTPGGGGGSTPGTGGGGSDGGSNGGVGSSGGSPEGVVPGLQAAPAEAGSCGSSIVCSSTPTPTTTATGLPDTGAPASGGLVGLGLAMVLGGLVLLRPRRGQGRHVMAL